MGSTYFITTSSHFCRTVVSLSARFWSDLTTDTSYSFTKFLRMPSRLLMSISFAAGLSCQVDELHVLYWKQPARMFRQFQLDSGGKGARIDPHLQHSAVYAPFAACSVILMYFGNGFCDLTFGRGHSPRHLN